ncbi:hypothetical protein EA472_15315 [Natrarchaeobius oligotrophus]|uniref:Uncharacterized protein n=2 Tax=Natrarchaeobius TaxID=2501796 RepID=A0A3N6M9Y2_NATCH|nr:hypothetical protein EA472_15315 [Natrarchaeobius chitinivorans]
MFGGSVVAAAAMTAILAPPNAAAIALTFGVVLVAGVVLSYTIGYIGIPSDSTAYPMSGPTSNPPEEPTEASRTDAEEFTWVLREGIGVAIASLFGLLLLAVFLLEITGLLGDSRTVDGLPGWLVVGVAGLTLVVLALWSWRGR